VHPVPHHVLHVQVVAHDAPCLAVPDGREVQPPRRMRRAQEPAVAVEHPPELTVGVGPRPIPQPEMPLVVHHEAVVGGAQLGSG